ncbi:MAG TPA: hypothetical protein VFJ14_16925 [Nocardioidaceae bacterium]|nr:hypothetical protein [Nocardioidaceae bacterium]
MIAGWPQLAPAILVLGHGSHTVSYAVAGVCALAAAVTIAPVQRVR